jgi:hypothetical protein
MQGNANGENVNCHLGLGRFADAYRAFLIGLNVSLKEENYENFKFNFKLKF